MFLTLEMLEKVADCRNGRKRVPSPRGFSIYFDAISYRMQFPPPPVSFKQGIVYISRASLSGANSLNEVLITATTDT